MDAYNNALAVLEKVDARANSGFYYAISSTSTSSNDWADLAMLISSDVTIVEIGE